MRDKSRHPGRLTEKEAEVMGILWRDGALTVREIRERYEEPLPHINTVSTIVRILEEKGFVGHKAEGKSFRYFPAVEKEEVREKTISRFVKEYLDNSYKSVSSALVQEEKISADELREILRMIEDKGD